MGAWGAKPFENDAALDWVGGLRAVADLRRTLIAVADAEADECIDVHDGETALAAAEIVASAGDGELSRLSPDATTWVGRHGKELADSDRILATRAVQRVLGADSELAELWDEDDTDNEWRQDGEALLARLARR